MQFFGYLDPGSSTLIIQAVLGGAAGVAVLFKTMGNKFTRKNKGPEAASEDSETIEPAESNVQPEPSD